LQVVGLREVRDLGVRRVVAVGAEVVGRRVAGRWGGGLAADQTPALLGALGCAGVVVRERWVDAGVSIREDGAEGEVGGREVAALLLESTGVEDSKDFRGLFVWDVGDKLERR
jgi:hypothetical protein